MKWLETHEQNSAPNMASVREQWIRSFYKHVEENYHAKTKQETELTQYIPGKILQQNHQSVM